MCMCMCIACACGRVRVPHVHVLHVHMCMCMCMCMLSVCACVRVGACTGTQKRRMAVHHPRGGQGYLHEHRVFPLRSLALIILVPCAITFSTLHDNQQVDIQNLLVEVWLARAFTSTPASITTNEHRALSNGNECGTALYDDIKSLDRDLRDGISFADLRIGVDLYCSRSRIIYGATPSPFRPYGGSCTGSCGVPSYAVEFDTWNSGGRSI